MCTTSFHSIQPRQLTSSWEEVTAAVKKIKTTQNLLDWNERVFQELQQQNLHMTDLIAYLPRRTHPYILFIA